MAIHERITDYTVSTLRNDVVDYRRVLRLTTETGTKAFLAFPDAPPADWLQFVDGGAVNVFLPSADFDATYRVLDSETPAFLTALTVFGLRAFSIDSGDEVPGHGEHDPQALTEFMARVGPDGGPVG